MLKRYLRLSVLVLFAFAANVTAHHVVSTPGAPLNASLSAPLVYIQGTVESLVVENPLAGTSQRFAVFVADSGQRLLLRGAGTDAIATGTTLAVAGKIDGSALFAESVGVIGTPEARVPIAKAGSAETISGMLRLGHADNFDGQPSSFFFTVFSTDGRKYGVSLAATLGVLSNEMHVTVSGSVAADGELVADTIVIDTPPPEKAAVVAKGVTINQVLVIPIKFKDANGVYPGNPFTIAQIQTAVFGGPGTGSNAEFYKEVSFGQQLLAGTVATKNHDGISWLEASLPQPLPAACDWSGTIGAQGDAAATAAGYNLASYQNVVYIFTSAGFNCGWAGLAYVGYGRAWIKQTLSLGVIGHELGHNFGLLHAASLDCGANVIGGSCSASEYGDPFDIMGNNRAMHFAAAQKQILNWIPASSTPTHPVGTTTYTLTPIETGGGATYAVRVPTALANRTYWIEYRQPIGFDSALSSFPNNGVQIRVAAPFETVNGSDDTQFLDITPATGAFTDGALLAGQTYVDTTYGVTINVLSATATALSVKVTTTGGKAASTAALVSSVNPSTVGQSVTFTATVTGTAPTGSVAFKDGATNISGCSAVALTGTGNVRTATCATTALTQATHSITAVFAGDAGNVGSTSPAVSQVVNTGGAKATTTALASSVNPSSVGQSVTFTATVTGTNPTGNVGFTNGGAGIAGCTAVALAGTGNVRTAACTTTTLAQGTRLIVSKYNGDAGNAVSTSSTLSQVVKSTTTTTQVSSPNPSTVGANVTFTATVNGTAPTGTVAFKDGATTITGCSAIALVGAGNARTAACTTSALTQATHSITSTYSGDAGNLVSTSAALSQIVNGTAALSTNVALVNNGGAATASSFIAGFSPAGAINGEVKGANWGAEAGWNDNTANVVPDWLQVNFNGQKTINKVVLYSMQDNYVSPVTPSDTMTFASYGLVDFQVQTWNGTAWVTAASIAGNNLVKRTVSIASVTTDRIRINVTKALGGYSRIVEVEAWTAAAGGPTPSTTTLASSLNPSTVGANVTFTATVNGTAPSGTVAFKDGATTITACGAAALAGTGNSRTATCTTGALTQATHAITAVYAGDAGNLTSTSAALSQVVNAAAGPSTNVARASNGGVASASSYIAGFSAAGTINGEVKGANWGAEAGWNDNTPNVLPDWLQVNFNGQKTINKVVVYSMQDNYVSPVTPSDTMTFALYGLVDFQVQTWNGTAWVTAASIAGNNLVKRTVSFGTVTTDRIRINVTKALGGYSRIVEVEAWTSAAGGPAATTTTMASSLNPATLGQSLTITATVSGTNPTGNVDFTDGGTGVAGCTAVALSGAGDARTAICTTAALAQGTRSIAAAYNGDTANASSIGSMSQVVNGTGPAATSTSLASSLNPSTVGAGVTFSATVTGNAPGGSVAFKDGTITIAGCAAVALSGTGNARTAACTTGALTQATHAIAATYSGDAGNLTSSSAAVSQVVGAVGPVATSTSLASSLNPSTVGANVTLTATVTGNAPGGSVAFKDGVTSIPGCAAVALSGTGNSRTAACTTGALTQATHFITAVYAGDTGNLTSTSATLSQVVNAGGGGGPVSCGMSVLDLGTISFDSSKHYFDLGSGASQVAVISYTATSSDVGKTSPLDIYEYIGGPVQRTVWVSRNRCEMTDSTRLVMAQTAPKLWFSVDGPNLGIPMVNMAVGETLYVMIRNWAYTPKYPTGKNSCIFSPCTTAITGAYR